MGRIYGVSSLLFYGADANCKNTLTQITPLQLAEQHGHTEVVQILMAYGADYHKVNEGLEKIS
jgi:ankyrin repeat protein